MATRLERLERYLQDRIEDLIWYVREHDFRTPVVHAGFWLCMILAGILFWIGLFCLVSPFISKAFAEETWKITAYCSCVKCCGKSDGITASGKKAKYGMVACNWLPFGTKVRISNLGTFTVSDRGAKSLFGSKNNHIKHLDVYMDTHTKARQFGVKYLTVSIQNRR